MSYVVYGERPATIAILNLLKAKGVDRHNVLLVDKHGICWMDRDKECEGDMNEY